MSVRLRLLTFVMRWAVRPILSKTKEPSAARRDFIFLARFLRRPPYLLHLVDQSTVPLHWVCVRHWSDEWVILYLHGGGYVAGSPATHLGLIGRIAKLTGLRVAAPDYRLAPEHPAPAAFDDVVSAHQALLAKGYPANRIILGGDSAGGGLALALLAHLCARGLTPAGLFAFSPWTDLAMTGGSLTGNAACDPLLPVQRMPDVVRMVLGSLGADDPRVSPLYGTFDGPPPVLLQVGSDEILLDDSRRMAAVLRDAGGLVDLDEWPDCPHVWQMLDGYLPEARLALLQVAAFVGRLTDGTEVSSLTSPQDGS